MCCVCVMNTAPTCMYVCIYGEPAPPQLTSQLIFIEAFEEKDKIQMTIIIMMPGLAYSDTVLQESPEEQCKELQMALCAASEFEQAKAVLLADAQSTVKSHSG